MIIIQKGKIDVSVVIGAVVVFAIIGAAIFGVYYFAFVKPAREALKDAKTSALNTLDSTLATVDTPQANTATATYRAQIQEAGSKGEVTSISGEIAKTYSRESKREELLNTVESATKGSFYSATGAGNTIKVSDLSTLSNTLTSEINSKTTLSELKTYKQTVSTQATSTWRQFLTSIIENISENKVVMRRKNSPYYWEYMSKSEALTRIQSRSWRSLRELTFENAGSYAIPILDTFQRAPTVTAGSTVDIAYYDYSSENLNILGANSTVLSVIYPKDTLGRISWTLSDDETTHSYSTDVWEAIKAATAGDAEAASVDWSNYAEELMESARDAGLGDYDLQALYVVEVSTQEDAKILTQYEQYQYDIKDIILLPHASS